MATVKHCTSWLFQAATRYLTFRLVTANLRGTSIFSKVNLRKAYHQIPYAEEDICRTTATIPFRLFEFTRMRYGLHVVTKKALADATILEYSGRNTPTSLLWWALLEEPLESFCNNFAKAFGDPSILFPRSCHLLKANIALSGGNFWWLISQSSTSATSSKVVRSRTLQIARP